MIARALMMRNDGSVTEFSAIEIAQKQRHLSLLQKSKEGKTLSKSEFDELVRYEKKASREKKRTILLKPLIKQSKKRKTAKKSTKSKKKISHRTPSRKRSTIDKVRVRQLALECEDLVQADAAAGLKVPLSEIFQTHPSLEDVWRRGRFLHNLRKVAAKSPSITQAARQLGLSSGQALRELLDNDIEASDIWDREQLQLYVVNKDRIFELAGDGVPWAVRIVDDFLKSKDQQRSQPGDLTRVTSKQLVELTGKTSQTIYDWRTKHGLMRNADKSFDLHIFIPWFEEFVLRKMAQGKDAEGALDRLKAAKTEKLQVEIAAHRGKLLDRSEVLMGQMAWVQNVVAFCSRKTEELARLCYGQPREKVAGLLKTFFSELNVEMLRVPGELRLPASIEKQFVELLKLLEGKTNGT